MIKRLSQIVCLFVIFSSLIPYAICAEAETVLPQVIVTADKREQTVENTAASITIITHDEIESQAATTVPEVLRNTAGIDVVSLGAPGDDLDIRLRGSDRDEVLIMIDGVSINNIREHRSSFLETIPLENVERIEVVRGSQSILYGSDAVGGVINIITRKGTEKPRYFVGFGGGNLLRFRETAGLSGNPGKTNYSLTVSRTDQRGRFDRDRFGELAFSGNFGHQISPEIDLQLGFNFIHGEQDLFYEFLTTMDPATGGLLVRIDPDNNRDLSHDLVVGRLALETLPTPWWEMQFHYGLFLDFERLMNPATGDTAPAGFVVGSQDFTGEGYANTLELKNFFALYESQPVSVDLTAGFEFQDERLNFRDLPTVFPGPGQEGNRQNYAPYCQATFRFLDESLIVSGGTRFDHNTTFGSELSPRASILYKLKKTKTTFRGSYGEGFHAPTILEYFTQVLLQQTGNPMFQAVRLQEELSQSYEVGIDQELMDWGTLSATFFYIDYDRLFDELQFIQDAFTTGAEVGVSITPWDFLTFGGNYTYLHARNEDAGLRLANRPKHHLNAFIHATPISDLSIRADVNYVSSRVVPNIISTSVGDLPFTFIDSHGEATSGTVGSYVKVDLGASYIILKERGPLKDWKAYFKIENLLDCNYQEKFGFPAPGITFLAGSQATF